jgi:hypothetical protein
LPEAFNACFVPVPPVVFEPKAQPSFPMSDNWMIVIPVDPVAVPPKERTKAAFDLLCALRSEAQDAELHISDTPEFFDGGSNFESVFCPFCQTDIWDWWIKAIDEWWNGTNHRALSAEMPCCGRVTTLNELDYVWPQGFACVAITLMNPDSDLEPAERQQVELALGLPVRVIWRHI